MGNREAYSSRGWAWFSGLTLVAVLLVAPTAASQATEVPSGGIMVVAAHPDDDLITSAGVMAQATGEVTVAYVTNGDRCAYASAIPTYCSVQDPGIGTTRQEEAVAGLETLGLADPGVDESNAIFMGYPNGYIGPIRDGNPEAIPADIVGQVTYAAHGLGFDDWHEYRTGSPATYTAGNMGSDFVTLISTYKPDHIFTHSRWDRHSDHRVTYYSIIDAIAAVQSGDPSYDPYIHQAIVHFTLPDGETTPAYGSWPESEDAQEFNVPVPWLETVSEGELLWSMRESFEVSGGWQTADPSASTKYKAIEEHTSQLADGFILQFVHRDEVFWVERLGTAEGRDDEYTADEGGALQSAVAAPGVLTNDVRGTSTAGALGPLEADLLSGPDHGSLSLDTDGSFTYSHDGSETTVDSFTYRPTQGAVNGSSATVTITIDPVNDAPTAIADGYSVERGDTLNVAASGVLGNDTDAENDTLSAVKMSDPSHGSLTLSGNGGFSYTHDGSASTTDSFTYRASDGQDTSNVVTVALTITSGGGSDPLAVGVSGATTGATGTSYSYDATVTGGNGTKSYAWVAERDGTSLSTGTGTSFSFASATGGDYKIELTVTDSSGSASDTADLKLLGDIAGLPFTSDIIWLADAGVTQGCNPPANDLYCPNDRVTRGQMAAFLVRFLDLTAIDSSVAFADVSGSVFEMNILKLATAGITRGCNPPANDQFCPNDFVTRGQMAAFLVRALGLTEVDSSIAFTDVSGSVFETNILKLATAGITRGCNPPANDQFCPNDFVTRGQMAAFLHRADGL